MKTLKALSYITTTIGVLAFFGSFLAGSASGMFYGLLVASLYSVQGILTLRLIHRKEAI